MSNIIPAATITAITGATASDEIARQGEAVIQMLEAYMGILLVKRDIADELITVTYDFSRIIKPKFAPINSVTSLEVITREGTYKADTRTLSVGKFTIEMLPQFWFCFPVQVLPKAIAAVKLSYNAGYYSTWAELPAILKQAALELLKYLFASGLKAGFQSEHLGDYSYTRGNIVRGLPIEIASMLDGVVL